MKRPFLLSTALLLGGCVRPPAEAPLPDPSPAVAFTQVNVLPMTHDTVLRDMTVLVRGDRITAIGRADRVRVPPGAQVIEGQGRYLMPGMVDAHFHLTGRDDVDPAVLALALSQGVTSVIEMGGMGQREDSVRLATRRRVLAGEIVGPIPYLAGPKVRDSTLTREGGMRLVEEQHAAGYELIKVYNQLSKEGFRGIMLRAQELGIPVVGHVVRSVGLEGVLGARQRGIVHFEEYVYDYFNLRMSDTTGTSVSQLDARAIPYLARITADAGAYVTPTLVFFEQILAQAEDLDQVLSKPEVRYIPGPMFNGAWAPERNPYRRSFTHPQHLRNLHRALAFQRDMLKPFHEAGVPLLVGTDAPASGSVPGFAVHRELANFVDAGLSPYEALVAGTRNAATYLKKDDFGTIEAGKRADLLLLTGNPLEDISNTQKIAGVMVRGRWLPQKELKKLMTVRTTKED